MACGCSKKSDLTQVTLNEVAHSIFYAPQYAAIELGYFAEEGIELTLINGLGADKTMTAVLAGEADIGFMGSESSIYVYAEGAEDYVVNFAQLTQRAGNFIVARSAEPNFKIQDLVGKTVVGGRAGGMPQMVFEYILKKNGIDPQNDLTIVQNIDFGLTAEAFSTGTGDYTVEFEPYANALEKEGAGAVVASLGVESGKVPYTSYSAKQSFIDKNPEIIQKFTNAIQKGLDYVNSHTPEEIAEVIAPQFPETEKEDLIAIVTRYYEQDTWKEDTVFSQDSFDLLQNILEEAGVLEERVPYDKLVTTTFAEEAAK
ncbi:ABC transporter substrate-binding protein [Anaerolentibacter hominis]|uniref:ABC transporter substrate-binding protein n=1 Tax=Anaerolentibacter hominis TaxID=3079009 RepID=UPI0031B85D12